MIFIQRTKNNATHAVNGCCLRSTIGWCYGEHGFFNFWHGPVEEKKNTRAIWERCRLRREKIGESSLLNPRAFFASLFTERLHHYVGAWKSLPNARTFNWSKIRPVQCGRSLSKARRTIFHVIRDSCSYYCQLRVALRDAFNSVCSVCHFYF